MYYTGFPEDVQVVGIGGSYAIKGFVSANLLVIDGEEFKVTGVGYLGNAFSQNVVFDWCWNVGKRETSSGSIIFCFN